MWFSQDDAKLILRLLFAAGVFVGVLCVGVGYILAHYLGV
jgi:hypothetical protein